jgi:uncharacterized membrane protein YphA (DoxX/SURF4 family)
VGDAIAVAARIVLAVVLLIAAVAKLRGREATRASMRALFGTPLGDALAIVVPVVEIVVAIALLFWWTVVPGVVAAVLVLAFTVVLVRAQVRRLPCPCFGASNRLPVGPSAIVRNGVLVALAILATGP